MDPHIKTIGKWVAGIILAIIGAFLLHELNIHNATLAEDNYTIRQAQAKANADAALQAAEITADKANK